jgi:hypothetical protein
MNANISTNGTNGHSADEQIDSLYAFWPGTTPAPQACPEAALSLTLKGSVGGIEAMLTIRGQSPEEFKRHLESVRGLLDQPQPAPQASSQGTAWCAVHDTAMRLNRGKDGRTWYSHKLPEGGFCKGRK